MAKDLYFLRKIAELNQGIAQRFPSKNTDYVALMENLAEGLYT